MIEKQYLFGEKIYTITACTKEDIPSHTERVLSYWSKDSNTTIELQQKYMEYCIDEGVARKVVLDEEDKGVYYIKHTSIDSAIAYCCWFENKRILAMMMYYARYTEHLNVVRFHSHTYDYIPFKFLINKLNRRFFHSHHIPLEVYVNSKEAQRLHEDHFLRYGIKEL